jgi:Golgi phosphoprotein 3
MVYLYEEAYLLCLHEEKTAPTAYSVAGFPYWLEGGLLIDLALQKRIASEPKHRLKLVSEEPTGDPLLDEIIGSLKVSEQPKKIAYWMGTFEFKPKKVFQQISEQLAAKGVLRQEDGDFSWVTPHPADNPLQCSAKFELRRRLRSLILPNQEPSLPEIALLSLLQASNKLELVFFKDERKLVRHRIDEQMMVQAMADPVGQALQEICMAVAAHFEED